MKFVFDRLKFTMLTSQTLGVPLSRDVPETEEVDIMQCRTIPSPRKNISCRLRTQIPSFPFAGTFHRRAYTQTTVTTTTTTTTTPVLQISNASIYDFGDPDSAPPLIHSISWNVLPSQAWAVVSPSTNTNTRTIDGKATLFGALTGHRRISPYQSAIFPSLYERGRDETREVKLVGFTHAGLVRGGGAGRDWTARYGAVRGEERRTLREVYFPELARARPLETLAVPSLVTESQDVEGDIKEKEKRDKERREAQVLFDELVEKLGLGEILDRPVIALSNGQARKARIVKALLQLPEILLLDEPLSTQFSLLLSWLITSHDSMCSDALKCFTQPV